MVNLRTLFGQNCPGPPRRFGIKQPNRTDMRPPTVYVNSASAVGIS
jgi:hypothetical protein